jgi:excisionase family DNA binding protein
MIDKLLTPEQAAEILQVKKSTIYVWLNRGVNLPAFRPAGTRTVRFDERELRDWIKRESSKKRGRNFEDL